MYYPTIKNIFKLLGFLFTLTFVCSTSAAVFIVDDNYDGVNNSSACEQSAGAFYSTTITDARVSAATNTTTLPHTIRICPGTYTEDNTFNDPEFIGMTIEGTTTNPVDVKINGVNPDGSVIYLRQNKMTLRNVNILGGRYGARSYTSDSTTFDNLILNKQNYDGILIQSSDNLITNTIVEKVGRMGIFFTSAGESLLIQSTKVLSATTNCIYSNRGNVSLIDVSVDGCERYGVILNKADGLPENLTISNLSINNTTLDGLYIRNYNASAASDNVNVENVQITDARRFGIYLVANDTINLRSIKIDQTTNDGISFNNTVNSILSDISVNNAGGDGIYFNATTVKNQLTGITISNSTAFGHYNNGGDDNTFNKLIISGSGRDGVYYRNESQNNVIKGYQIYKNRYGILLNNVQNNLFASGEIFANTNGIRLTGSSAKNEFIENYVYDNSAFGAIILGSGINESNSFYQNCFINPAVNIRNQETDVSNIFDNGTTGNFYGSSPAGSGYSETCLDSDSNAICDLSYTIPNSSIADKDNFPSRDLRSINAACFSDAIASPNITFQKTSKVVSDPINGTNFPKAIPGAVIEYTLKVTNSGLGNSDVDSVAIIDNLPANTRFVFGSPANPADFLDGTPTSGLSYTYNGLSSTTDDIQFSNDGGATFITPSVDVDGIDLSSPFINFIKVNPKGALNGDSGTGSPNFSISYKIKIN